MSVWSCFTASRAGQDTRHGSRATADAVGASLFTLRDGKVATIIQYLDPELAFADLSLAPEAGSQR